MIDGYAKLGLLTMNDGAAEQLFQTELARVLDNIADPNTDPKAKRTITLKIVIEADEERRNLAVTVSSSTKLTAMRAVVRAAAFGVVDGERVAVQTTARQMQLFDEEKPKPAGPQVVRFPEGSDA